MNVFEAASTNIAVRDFQPKSISDEELKDDPGIGPPDSKCEKLAALVFRRDQESQDSG